MSGASHACRHIYAAAVDLWCYTFQICALGNATALRRNLCHSLACMQDALLIPTYSSRVRYTFQGVDTSQTPGCTFLQNDNEVSYATYYR